jgi:hypothetical protein
MNYTILEEVLSLYITIYIYNKPKLLVNMKALKTSLFLVIALALALQASSCKKESSTTSEVLYVPTSSDVTENATLTELQNGRDLYINNCGGCHELYLPESFTPSRWRSILPNMTPRTSLSSTQVQLVTKYVTKGK